MLGLITNLSIGETILIVVLAIMIFGKRLPEVAAQVVSQIRKLRKHLDDMRRETGIDREFRNIRREFDSAAREATREDRPALPEVVERVPVRPPPMPPSGDDATEAETESKVTPQPASPESEAETTPGKQPDAS